MLNPLNKEDKLIDGVLFKTLKEIAKGVNDELDKVEGHKVSIGREMISKMGCKRYKSQGSETSKLIEIDKIEYEVKVKKKIKSEAIRVKEIS